MATNNRNGFTDGWPAWAKPIFALAAAALWIGAPTIAAWNLAARTVQASGVADYQPILIVLVGMTTVTISGIFLFMTFRIDRGVVQEAERVANDALKRLKETADKDMKAASNDLKKVISDAEKSVASLRKQGDYAKTKLNNILEDIRRESGQKIDKAIGQKLDEEMTSERVREGINARITDEELRRHIEAVLMLDANGRIVAEYARERAQDLDAASVERLIRLLNDIIQSLQAAEGGDGNVGWWRRLRARFTQ